MPGNCTIRWFFVHPLALYLLWITEDPLVLTLQRHKLDMINFQINFPSWDHRKSLPVTLLAACKKIATKPLCRQVMDMVIFKSEHSIVFNLYCKYPTLARQVPSHLTITYALILRPYWQRVAKKHFPGLVINIEGVPPLVYAIAIGI